MTKYRIGERKPAVAADAFVAREATLIGDVRVAERASVWFGAVARASGGVSPVPGFALFIGDHLARSVRGVPGAPPGRVIPA